MEGHGDEKPKMGGAGAVPAADAFDRGSLGRRFGERLFCGTGQ